MNILELPRVSLLDKKQLPTISGVYFVFNEHDEPLYVGQSENIRRRLTRTHHCHDDMEKQENVFIAWLGVAKGDLLSMEKHFISSLNPAWNKVVGGLRPGSGRKPGWRKPNKRDQVLLFKVTDAERAMALAIGDGNASLGVRRALYRATQQDDALAD